MPGVIVYMYVIVLEFVNCSVKRKKGNLSPFHIDFIYTISSDQFCGLCLIGSNYRVAIQIQLLYALKIFDFVVMIHTLLNALLSSNMLFGGH